MAEHSTRTLATNSSDQQPLLAGSKTQAAPSMNRTNSAKECAVAFSSPIYIAHENEGQAIIDLMRRGSLDNEVAVTLETETGSAVAGTNFEHMSKEIVIPAGQRSQRVTIKLLHTPWNATVEFQVNLSNPKHCYVPKSSLVARVKVMDRSNFPSDAFKSEIEKGTLGTVPGFRLYFSYWWWNFATAKRAWVVLLTLIFGQVENLYALGMIYVNMYMVNVVCNINIDVEGKLLMPTREETAYVIAALHIVPWILLHINSLIQIRLDMKGDTAEFLQKAMFRKFMNLSQESQKTVSFETLNWGLTMEAPMIANSFVAGLDVIEVVVNVGLNFAFVLFANPKAAPFMVLIPFLLVAWSFFRQFCFPPLNVKAETTAMSAHANEVYSKLDLVRAFFLRPVMNEDFAAKTDTLQRKTVAVATNNANTHFGLAWIPHLVTGLYIIYAVPKVVSHETKLGTMLAMIAIIAKVGAASLKAHSTIMSIVATFPVLRNVTMYLNKKTDVDNWKELIGKCSEIAANAVDDQATPLVCDKVGLKFEDQQIFWDVNLKFNPGRLVAVYGPKRCGKHLFLRVLSSQDFPTEGFVLNASSSFALFMPRESLFLDRSLTDNLLLGLAHLDDEHIDYDRVKSILKLCLLGHLVPYVDKDLAAQEGAPADDYSGWRIQMSFTDWKLLAIARALIAAPVFLVMECPFQFFDQKQAETIRSLLTRHIKDRGILNSSSVARERTVIFSTEDMAMAEEADDVVEFSRPQGSSASSLQPWTVKMRNGKNPAK